MTERRTPLYDFHFRAARNVVKGGGDYMFPTSYTSPVEEHLNTRTNVGMQDLSTMGEVDIKGPGAERLINHLLVNEVRDMEPGQSRYSTMCNESGGVVDDVTVYKFNDEHFMIVTSSGPRKKTSRWIADHADRHQHLCHRMTAAHRAAGGAGAALARLSQDRGRWRGPGCAQVLPLRAVPHRRRRS